MSARKNFEPLLRRQFASSRGASVLLVVIVLVTCTVLAVWPRAVAAMFTQDVQQTMRKAPATLRALVAFESASPPTGPGDPGRDHSLAPDDARVWGAMEDAMARLHQSVDEPLQAVLDEGHYYAWFQQAKVILPESVPRISEMTLALNFDPKLAGHIRMVEGRTPKPLTDSIVQLSGESGGSGQPLELMMSRATAGESRWEVGTTRRIQAAGTSRSIETKLVGIFEPKNADADFWKLNRSNLYPASSTSPSGDGLTVGASAYAAPAGFEYALPLTMRVGTIAWFPMDIEALNSANAAEVSRQLTAFSGSVQEFARAANAGVGVHPTIETLQFNSESAQYLQESISRAGATNQILAMMAAGPLGVCLAALALACRMVLDRRRPTLVLAAARGASRKQLHGSMAVEGLFLGLPAAVAGVAMALLAFPGPLTPATWGLPLLMGLAPALLLGLSPVHGSLRARRSDLNPKAHGRIRLTLEVAVLALAVISVFLLFQRGFAAAGDRAQGAAGTDIGGSTTAGGATVGGNGDASVDLLLAATPLLLALAACVLVLRLYPLPLRALARTQAAKAPLLGFLGSVRSLRAPGGGLVPVLSIVVGLAVVVFSAVLLQTLRAGVSTAAQTEIAAELRITSPSFSADERAKISQLDGIGTSVGITTNGGAALTLGGSDDPEDRSPVRMVVADLEDLAEVQAGVPGSVPPQALNQAAQPAGETLPVVLSDAVRGGAGDTGVLELFSDVDVTIAATAPAEINLTTSDKWVLVDEELLAESTGLEVQPDVILASLSANADPSAVLAELESMGGQLEAATVASRTAQLSETPLAGGLQTGLLTVMVFIGGLCATIVIMTSVISAPSRNKLLGLLRTLGFPRRQDPALLLWEFGPVAAAGVIAGVVLGLLLPLLVIAGVDLRIFTGGDGQPPVTYDPLLLTALVAGFILIVLLAVLAAIAAGRRQRVSSVLRIGEEV